jgi:hypothetical protein
VARGRRKKGSVDSRGRMDESIDETVHEVQNEKGTQEAIRVGHLDAMTHRSAPCTVAGATR